MRLSFLINSYPVGKLVVRTTNPQKHTAAPPPHEKKRKEKIHNKQKQTNKQTNKKHPKTKNKKNKSNKTTKPKQETKTKLSRLKNNKKKKKKNKQQNKQPTKPVYLSHDFQLLILLIDFFYSLPACLLYIYQSPKIHLESFISKPLSLSKIFPSYVFKEKC